MSIFSIFTLLGGLAFFIYGMNLNSGLMNIGNTVAVIMGSNIGTTITAWIILVLDL